MTRNKETALKVIQGGDLRRRFRRRVGNVYQPFTGVVVKAQIRDKVGGTLLLDLSPHFTVNSSDPTALDLHVPGAYTAALTRDAVWDIFFDGQYITGGYVDVMRPVTQL